MSDNVIERAQELFAQNKNKEATELVIERAQQLFTQNKNKEATELLRNSFNELERQLEIATKKVTELQLEKDNALNVKKEADVVFTEFSHGELSAATDKFNALNKIGEGSSGAVYKGFLRYTNVAIKMLKPEAEGSQLLDKEFNQELEILGKVRHPNLVSLIGASREARALIYNYLPNGSLHTYLFSGNKDKILPYQDRIRIASEICSALIFLHSQNIAHGDLKPENVLLDSNLTCRLTDFGMARKLQHSNDTLTPLHQTKKPKGSLAYMDPEYLSFGELTPQSDVFSFGIILLQFVTGRDPRGLRSIVEQAVDSKKLEKFLDNSAGKWPSGEAMKLAQLGLACSHQMRRRRSDLKTDVWPALQSMKQGATSRGSKWRF